MSDDGFALIVPTAACAASYVLQERDKKPPDLTHNTVIETFVKEIFIIILS